MFGGWVQLLTTYEQFSAPLKNSCERLVLILPTWYIRTVVIRVFSNLAEESTSRLEPLRAPRPLAPAPRFNAKPGDFMSYSPKSLTAMIRAMIYFNLLRQPRLSVRRYEKCLMR